MQNSRAFIRDTGHNVEQKSSMFFTIYAVAEEV